MNILVIGKGGREHSILQKIAASPRVKKLYVAPGNAGMKEAVTVSIPETDMESMVQFAKKNEITLTIVGPENPLMAGIVNRFQQENLPIFGPTKEAAIIEGSKQFAKDLMMKYDVPTADYAVFQSAEKAKRYIDEKGAPIVIKADGLAAGKGVVVAQTVQEAHEAVDNMMVEKTFAQAGATIVVEEFLQGREFSLMAFVHQDRVFPMIAAQDHKRAFDGDQGPNTGGMGAFAPVPAISDEMLAEAQETILQKTADAMIVEGKPFTGILYAGLMHTQKGIQVIEFNARFGDPETQVIMPLLENDLVQVFEDVLAGNDPELQWKKQACAGVVLAAKGYPGSYIKDVLVPDRFPADCFVQYAGVKQKGNQMVSAGGRVLLVGSLADTLDQAAVNVYENIKSANPESDLFFRSDIGK